MGVEEADTEADTGTMVECDVSSQLLIRGSAVTASISFKLGYGGYGGIGILPIGIGIGGYGYGSSPVYCEGFSTGFGYGYRVYGGGYGYGPCYY